MQGDEVLIMGFPRDPIFNNELVFSTGKILGHLESKNLIQQDPAESQIDFDESVEFVVEAKSLVGMSGGGAFDFKGTYLGVLVRGNDQASNGRFFYTYFKSTSFLFYNNYLSVAST